MQHVHPLGLKTDYHCLVTLYFRQVALRLEEIRDGNGADQTGYPPTSNPPVPV